MSVKIFHDDRKIGNYEFDFHICEILPGSKSTGDINHVISLNGELDANQ